MKGRKSRRSVRQTISGGAWQGSVTQTAGHIGRINFAQPGSYREIFQPGTYRDQYVKDAERGAGVALHKYNALMRLYWLLQVLSIAAGICVAVLATTEVPRWSLALLGALAAGAQTLIAATNLQERGVVSGMLADRMGRELRDFHGQFGSYATGDTLATLHNRIEKIRSDASTARFRLDRAKSDLHLPPVTEGGTGSAATGHPE